jgi:hypothetical protein
MSSKPKKPVKKTRRGSSPGQFAYGSGIRRLTVPEPMRWRMYDALVKLHGEWGRPVTREELAAELNLAPEEVHVHSLVNVRYAQPRPLPGETWWKGQMGFVPANLTATRLDIAFTALENAETGKHPYTIREGGRRIVAKSLTINASFRSRVRKLLARVKAHLAIRSWPAVTSERLPQVLAAVYEVEMMRSLVPQSEWSAQSPTAKRARKNSLNRQSDFRRFLEWAQYQGHVDLRFLDLHNRSGQPMLTRAWATFNEPLPYTSRWNAPLTFARRAMEFGADSPETLAEMGFERFTEWVMDSGKYANRSSAMSMLSKFRPLWNAGRTGYPHLPAWDPPTQFSRRRLPDGGLVRTWWSTNGVMAGKETLLDAAGMEEQRRQVIDMKDWWTLANPTTRAKAKGGPLPPRPQVAREGGRRIGARSEDEPTASKPLWTVSRFQRFAITDDPVEAERIAAADMRTVRWDDLFANLGRVERFIRYEMQRSADEHDGALIKTNGTDAALYVHLLAAAYFPAFVNRDLDRLDEEESDLPDTREGFARQREIGRERKRLLKRRREWKRIAEQALLLFRSEEERLEGFKPKKLKEEIAENLSHSDIGRIADVFRMRRLDAEGELRRKTKHLIRTREAARTRACEVELAGGGACGAVCCDTHHAIPSLQHGIAVELVHRTYSFLVMKELWMRLPVLLPWRPSEFCRMRIGQHLDPDTLTISAPRYKNPRTGGVVARREAHIPSVQPIEGMDPESTTKLVDVLPVALDLAQPFLATNPTEVGLEGKADQPRNDEYLFLSWDGLSVRKSKGLAATITRALEEGARAVNASLKDGDAPIRLPTGWGTTGSYVFRFLWGHMAIKHGASMSAVALALGNTERTTRQYYHKVRSDTAINAVARTTRDSKKAKDGLSTPETRAESGSAPNDYDRDLDRLIRQHEDGLLNRKEFDQRKDALRTRHRID